MPLFKCSASKAKPKNGIRYITDPKKAAFVSAKNLFEDEDYAKWRVLPYLITGMTQAEILDCFCPVGSVKVTATNANPEGYVGGVWERIQTDGSALYYWERKA